jgi:putative Holliday junction resolvase
MPDPAPGAMTPSRRAIASAGERAGPAQRLALGFDVGTRRIGVAVGSELTGAARPLCVIEAGPRRQWESIAEVIGQWQPEVLVVGIARHPDGAAHEMTVRCERFARQLQGRTGLAVARVDERYSSAVVGADRASDQDAAAVILQQWLDEGARR